MTQQSRKTQILETPQTHKTPESRGYRQIRRKLLIRWGVTISIIVSIAVIACSSALVAFQTYQQYRVVRVEATDGINHLKRVQTLLGPLLKHPAIPTTTLLASLETELTAATSDFDRAQLDSKSLSSSIAVHYPGVEQTLNSALTMLDAANEASLGGIILVKDAQILVPLLNSNPFASLAKTTGTSPILDAATLAKITTQFESGINYLDEAVLIAHNANFSALPSGTISASEIASIHSVLTQWPAIQSQIATVDSWLRLAPSLLGVSTPEKFLVELMDRGELRATGGFIGSYGVMTIQYAKIQAFTLNDIFALDVPYVKNSGWPTPPAKYSWWPFAGFALRDSNLSADFPTTAKLGIQLLQIEGGPQVQGVVALTIPLIEKILKITGSVPLPEYSVTVTPENLESLIRYYTETSAASAGSDLPPSDQLTTLHERFTALLGRALMSKLEAAGTKQLIPILQAVLSSLHTKDLQLYSSNSTAETLLAKQGLDASLTRGPGDGITIVDTNDEGNKANLFTKITYTDAVSITQSGTATHELTITYNFDSSTAPSMIHYLYGRDYYRPYVRIYLPQTAKLLSLEGFIGGQNPSGFSDEPGRQMWAGYIFVQDGVPYSLSLKWTVPNVVTHPNATSSSYALDFQHQAGSNQYLNVTVSQVGIEKPVLVYHAALDRDQLFTVSLANTIPK